jgi:putative pyruvate formate lyase activating enzyme
MFEPSYLELYATGELKAKRDELEDMLENCTLCPRKCGVNRKLKEIGFCGNGYLPIISSYGPHFGEESVLVGRNGSGTIFIGGCNLKCVFCQNFEISHQIEGREVTPQVFAEIMISLQESGCHNINIVTPTHVVPQILQALMIGIEKGLRLPLVYNTGGYDEVRVLKLIKGVFDIYMPDFKFTDPTIAKEFTGAPDYPETVKNAIKEMHNQVDDLIIENGIAKRGLIVRHLVLPYGSAGTKEVAKFIASISKNTYLNVMAQYRPCGYAYKFEKLSRNINSQEYEEALSIVKEEGLYRLDHD